MKDIQMNHIRFYVYEYVPTTTELVATDNERHSNENKEANINVDLKYD